MPCWKLVRDKIPDMIRASHGDEKIVVKKYTGIEEKEILLRSKIVEEAAELAETGSLEEAADLLEALYEWLQLTGNTLEQVEAVRRKKREKLGGFEEGYVVFWLDRENC